MRAALTVSLSFVSACSASEPAQIASPSPIKPAASAGSAATLAVPTDSPDAPIAPERFLGAQVDPTLTQIAHFARRGKVTLEPGGEWVDDGMAAVIAGTGQFRVLEVGKSHLRVLLDGRGVRLAVYLPQDCFDWLVVHPVELRVTPDLLPTDGFVRLRPGASFESLAVGEDGYRGWYERWPVRANGYVPAEALGLVASPSNHRPPSLTEGDQGVLALRFAHMVFDAPDGAEIAFLSGHSTERLLVRHLGSKPGWDYIRYEDNTIELEGWIARDKPVLWQAFAANGTGYAPDRSIQLASGAKLFASATGPQVGVTDSVTGAQRVAEESQAGRTRVLVSFERVGRIQVWVPSDSVIPASDELKREREGAVEKEAAGP